MANGTSRPHTLPPSDFLFSKTLLKHARPDDTNRRRGSHSPSEEACKNSDNSPKIHNREPPPPPPLSFHPTTFATAPSMLHRGPISVLVSSVCLHFSPAHLSQKVVRSEMDAATARASRSCEGPVPSRRRAGRLEVVGSLTAHYLVAQQPGQVFSSHICLKTSKHTLTPKTKRSRSSSLQTPRATIHKLSSRCASP